MVKRRDLPPLAWGDTLCAARLLCQRICTRTTLITAGSACLAATIPVSPAPRFVWNASASAPLGLYRVRPGAAATVGDTVVAWLPPSARALAAGRRYLPSNVPLIKRVAAGPGDTVCASGSILIVNGQQLARRRDSDSLGRAMPWWHGCRQLRTDELFLLMSSRPDSFDGRYFGPSSAKDVIGRATLLWAR